VAPIAFSKDYEGVDYERFWAGPGKRYLDRLEQRIVKHVLPGGGSIVEIGAGFGRLGPCYIDKYQDVHMVEPASNLRAAAMGAFGSAVKYHDASVYALPFADNSFDAVLMVRVFHHLHDSEAALKELHRILRPGGTLVFSYSNLRNPGRVARFVLGKVPNPFAATKDEYLPDLFGHTPGMIRALAPILDQPPEGNVWECLNQIDALLNGMGEDMPAVTWLIRADQSVEFSTGSFESGYSNRRSLWDKLQERGHELGWHLHTMSYFPPEKQFVFDPVPGWLAEAHERLASSFSVNATRTGWDYGSSALLSALDRLRVIVDFSALPGNVLWFKLGKVTLMTDWRDCPTVPYHPSGNDYQRSGSAPLKLWEVPAAQFRRSLAGTVTRGLLRLRHGCVSMSGLTNQTQLFTDRWRERPVAANDVWAFFFHPYDLTETGIQNFRANIWRLQNLPDVEFKTATEVSTWLSTREQQQQRRPAFQK